MGGIGSGNTKIKVDDRTKLLIKGIIDYICEILTVEKTKVKSKSRKQEYVDARFIIVSVVRDRYKKVPYIYIGEELNVTYSTMIHADKEVKDLIKTDKKFKQKYNLVIDILSKEINIA